MNIKGIVKFILSWGISIGLVMVLFKKMDLYEFKTILSTMEFKLLVISFIFVIASNAFFGVEKYRHILEVIGYKLSFRDVFLVRTGGLFVKFISPVKSGEIVRLIYLNKKFSIGYRKGVYSIILNWSFRIISLLIIFVAGFLISNYSISLYLLFFYSALVFIVFYLLFIIWGRRYKGYLRVLFYSLMLELSLIISYYFIFRASGVSIGFRSLYFIVPFILIIESLPLGVGGIGVRELGIIFFFKNYSDFDRLFTAALTASFINVMLPSFISAFFLKSFLVEFFMSDYDYIKRREKNIITRYRLKKRTIEVFNAIKKLSREKEISLLDVGANDGRMLSFLKNNIKTCIKAVGIEPEERFIKAKKEDIEIVKADCENIPFNDGNFDFVIMASVVEHIKDIEKGMREVKRVLKKGGYLIITSVNPFLDRLASLLSIKPDDHLRRYTRKELVDYLGSMGFNVVEAKSFGPVFYNLVIAEKIDE